MRTIKFMVINFILVFALITYVGISKVEAFDFLGEFCWEKESSGTNDEPLETFILAISNVGNNHFIVNGKGSVDSPEDLIVDMVIGSAEIIGSNVVMILNTSEDPPEDMGITTFHVTLSLSTLNGTYNAIMTIVPKSTNDSSTFLTSGTFRFVSCP